VQAEFWGLFIEETMEGELDAGGLNQNFVGI
jgi:hypothetical protein